MFLLRSKGLAGVVELTVPFTMTGYDKNVSYVEREILNTFVRRLYDDELMNHLAR